MTAAPKPDRDARPDLVTLAPEGTRMFVFQIVERSDTLGDDALARESELREALTKLRRGHRDCEDTWYSCPKHPEGCSDDSAGDDCDCGADKANAIIDDALATPAGTEALARP